jgi:AraC-like DNA-binding protein
MKDDRFFKDPLLPFAELRCSRTSSAPYKPHIHQCFSIGAVDKGAVEYNVGGTTDILAPGSLVLINPETLHVCNPAGQHARSYYMLHLDTNWCLKVQQSMWEIDRFVEAEEIRIDDDALYDRFCRTMENLMNKKILLQEKEQLLYELACNIFFIACKSLKPRKETHTDIETLKKLLAQDLDRDLPLNILAGELDANPYTLIRSFKAACGITPHAFRMNCRIEKARRLLRQGCSIADTALECGFFDQSHLHRHFKAMTTVTPNQYRVNFIQ